MAHLNDTQLASYGVLYREGTGKKESGVELHHLVKTKNPKLAVTSLPAINHLCGRFIYDSMVMGKQDDDEGEKEECPSPAVTLRF